MALYTNDSKDRVRDAVDFLELVSTRTELRRAGPARYEGLCPFHEERTPSFSVNPAEKLYYCFGCGAGGNLFGHAPEADHHEQFQNFGVGKLFLQRCEGSVLDEVTGKNLIRRRHHRTFDRSEKIAGRPAFDSS